MNAITLKNGLFIVREKRTYIRKKITVPIIYGYLIERLFIRRDGISCDVSTGGMSFFADRPFCKGNNVQIHSSYLWSRPKVGTVQWCSMKMCSLYKIGVLFL